jgi:hypothetical protein
MRKRARMFPGECVSALRTCVTNWWEERARDVTNWCEEGPVTRLVMLGLIAMASACAVGTDGRDEYETEMNAICSSGAEAFDDLPPPVDLDEPLEGHEERVRRINARAAQISRQMEAKLRAVEPPADVSEEHRALLAAIDELKRASTRTGQLAREAGKAHEEGDQKNAADAYARMTDSYQALFAAQKRFDRAAMRLGLHHCRQPR